MYVSLSGGRYPRDQTERKDLPLVYLHVCLSVYLSVCLVEEREGDKCVIKQANICLSVCLSVHLALSEKKEKKKERVSYIN